MKNYLEKRIKEMLRLSDTYGAIADRLSDHPNYDKEREEKNALSFEYLIRARENKKALNYLNAQTESQNVTGNEYEKEVCQECKGLGYVVIDGEKESCPNCRSF